MLFDINFNSTKYIYVKYFIIYQHIDNVTYYADLTHCNIDWFTIKELIVFPINNQTLFRIIEN